MVSRAEIRASGFKSLPEYFENIRENYINGNLSDIWLMICELSKPQKVTFLEWCNQEKQAANDPNDYEYLTSVTLQILRK